MSDELSEAIAALEARLAACPKQERDYPDYEAYQAAIKAWHKLQPPIATLQSRVQRLRSENPRPRPRHARPIPWLVDAANSYSPPQD